MAAGLDHNQLQVQKIIASLPADGPEGELREKLLDLEDDSYANVCKVIQRWCVSRKSANAMRPAATAAAVRQQQQPRRQGQQQRPQQQQQQQARKQRPNRKPTDDAIKKHLAKLEEQNKCARCGQNGHVRSKCTKQPGDFKCGNCGARGHVDRVCGKPKRAASARATSEQPPDAASPPEPEQTASANTARASDRASPGLERAADWFPNTAWVRSARSRPIYDDDGGDPNQDTPTVQL